MFGQSRGLCLTGEILAATLPYCIIRLMSKWLKRLGSAIMAKRQQSSVLNRLTGKKLVFDGKFGYGALDSLKAMADAAAGHRPRRSGREGGLSRAGRRQPSKTIQKKAMSLNAKGASIQVIDADAFKKLVEPTDEEIIALLKAGDSQTYAKIYEPSFYHHHGAPPPKRVIQSEDLSGVKLANVTLDDTCFNHCRFVGAELNQVAHRHRNRLRLLEVQGWVQPLRRCAEVSIRRSDVEWRAIRRRFLGSRFHWRGD